MQDLHDILNNEINNRTAKPDTGFQGDHVPAEIRPLLKTAATLFSIPKNSVPEPVMQRKYISAETKQRVWFAWIHVSRLATISMAAVLFISGIGGTVYAATQSLPGQALFPLRKSAERIELSLTKDPVKRANLQLALTQKRLDDVQKVFQSPQPDSNMEIAALDELSQQTNETIATVKDAATSNALPSTDHPIVTSLEKLTKEQQNVLNQIKPDNDAKAVAMNVQASANQNIDQVDQIKKIIEIASAAQDQSLATLNANPNIVTISGTINNITPNSITVEKLTFSITDKTSITDSEGNEVATITPDSLNTKADIKGAKQSDGSLSATEIILLDMPTLPDTGAVQGAATGTPASTTSPSSALNYSLSIIHKKATGTPDSQNDATATPPEGVDNTKAVGTFILEDPAPQYVP